jgi:hypothetical protein
MSSICEVDSLGVSNTLSESSLVSRGLITFCQITESGVDPVSGDTADQIRQRGLISMCPVDATGVAQGGILTVKQLQQRGIIAFCPVDETGTEITLGGGGSHAGPDLLLHNGTDHFLLHNGTDYLQLHVASVGSSAPTYYILGF